MEMVYLIIGFLIGGSLCYLWFRAQTASGFAQCFSEKSVAEQRVSDLTDQKASLEAQCVSNQQKILQLTSEIASSKMELENHQKKLTDQKGEIERLQEKFTLEFQNLANRIFEEKGKTFSEQHVKTLDQLLKPFQEKIKDFEKKVEDAYEKELRDKISLREEVRKLYDLNTKLSTEATNLTRALKGDTKKQGNWGELMLEKILENSGLKRDVEYQIQYSTRNLDGSTIKPDIVVLLPDNKHLIIDAKVSLTAYDRFVMTEESDERDRHLRDHLHSVRGHVKELSSKNYYTGEGLSSPDFVLLFMPMESAFSLAVQSDGDLFNYAWEKRIVIVSPTTLLATLRTVASLWKIESQNKNAMEIARLSGAMYDKLEGFIQDMIKVGKAVETTQEQYRSAMNKLYDGQGNVIKTAEKIKALGAKATKSLPQALIDRSDN